MKNVLVTGGTRGLGLAISEKLANEGFHVIASGRSMSRELEELISRPARKGRVRFAALDLSQSSEIHGFISGITKQHGPLYGLINNAALAHDGVLATMHESQIEELVRVNLLGTMLVTKYACRSMLVQREGRVVNIASIVARTGFSGLSVYAATKSALIGFSKSLARELGKAGITINTVSPGFLETKMTQAIDGEKLETIRRRSPLGRLASVSEVAATVAFLLSDDAATFTGTDITVDAGSTA